MRFLKWLIVGTAALAFIGHARAEDEIPKTEVHGGSYLWYYRPFLSGSRDNFSLYALWVDLDATLEDFGFHVEPRFRDTPLRNYFTSNVWIQEVYGFYKMQNLTVKAGKVYSHFGSFWDGSFYGNILYFDGLKLSPDEGISVEGRLPNDFGIKANYYVQYFATDGSTNGSLGGTAPATGRDTLSIPGGRRRNEVIARVEPMFGNFTLGASYEHFIADIPAIGSQPQMWNGVNRYGGDLTFTMGDWSIFAEYANQAGQSVIDFPITGKPAQKINYYWAGTSYQMGKWKFYYNFSEGDYSDQSVREYTHIPGASYQWRKFLTVIGEYAYWTRTAPGDFTLNDNSLNIVLKAAF